MDRARNALLTALSATPHLGGWPGAHEFMSAIGRIGRANPSQSIEGLGAFLEETAPRVRDAVHAIENWVFRLADRAEYASGDDEALALYESLREDRSTLQFLFDLYRDGPASAALANIETDCIDESLKELVEVCGYGGGRPASIPSSHWWWG